MYKGSGRGQWTLVLCHQKIPKDVLKVGVCLCSYTQLAGTAYVLHTPCWLCVLATNVAKAKMSMTWGLDYARRQVVFVSCHTQTSAFCQSFLLINPKDGCSDCYYRLCSLIVVKLICMLYNDRVDSAWPADPQFELSILMENWLKRKKEQTVLKAEPGGKLK